MKIKKKVFVIIFSILWFSSCTKEINFQEKLTNTKTNVTLNIYRIPREGSLLADSWEREISIYGLAADFNKRENPIIYGFYQGVPAQANHPNTFFLEDIKYNALYIRITIWRHIWNLTTNEGTIYYRDSIPIPTFNCDITVDIFEDKWVREY